MKAARKVDVLVAEKVMGWKDVREDEMMHWDFCGQKPHIMDGEFCIPNYSTDIEAAWAVFEHFSSRYIEWNDSDASWSVQLDFKRRLRDDCRGMGYANTAPHAICLAALKAVGHI